VALHFQHSLWQESNRTIILLDYGTASNPEEATSARAHHPGIDAGGSSAPV
jgi:hypothetical protein